MALFSCASAASATRVAGLARERTDTTSQAGVAAKAATRT
jgi:hypothetical protein